MILLIFFAIWLNQFFKWSKRMPWLSDLYKSHVEGHSCVGRYLPSLPGRWCRDWMMQALDQHHCLGTAWYGKFQQPGGCCLRLLLVSTSWKSCENLSDSNRDSKSGLPLTFWNFNLSLATSLYQWRFKHLFSPHLSQPMPCPCGPASHLGRPTLRRPPLATASAELVRPAAWWPRLHRSLPGPAAHPRKTWATGWLDLTPKVKLKMFLNVVSYYMV